MSATMDTTEGITENTSLLKEGAGNQLLWTPFYEDDIFHYDEAERLESGKNLT